MAQSSTQSAITVAYQIDYLPPLIAIDACTYRITESTYCLVSPLKQFADIKISKDGRGRYLDDTFIEQFITRSLKQEAFYLHGINDGFQAKRIINEWIGFYNSERPQTALDKRTPDAAYFHQSETPKAT